MYLFCSSASYIGGLEFYVKSINVADASVSARKKFLNMDLMQDRKLKIIGSLFTGSVVV